MNAQRKEYFAVVRPPHELNPNPEPIIAQSLEHAEAIKTCKEVEMPTLGPWRVARLVEAE